MKANLTDSNSASHTVMCSQITVTKFDLGVNFHNAQMIKINN